MTTASRVWGKCCENEIEILSYDESTEKEALDVIMNSFFQHENVSVATGVKNCKQAQEDLSQLCVDVAKYGVSLVAKHTPSNRIVGVSFNALQTTGPIGQPSYFEQFRDHRCKSPSSKGLMNYMIQMDAKIDLFDQFQITNLLEIMFIAVLPEFFGKGIGVKMCECSVELAKGLKYGKYREILPEQYKNRIPQLVSALWTSTYSQSVGRRSNFLELNEVPYTEFKVGEKTFADVLGPSQPSSILVVKQI